MCSSDLPNQYEMKFESWAPRPRAERRDVQLDFDDLFGKAFRITDPVNNPTAPGFSVITPMDPWWPRAKDRTGYEDIVRQRLNDPTFPDRFLASKRTGMYLRVLREGIVRANDQFTLEKRGTVSLVDAIEILHGDGIAPARIAALAEIGRAHV